MKTLSLITLLLSNLAFSHGGDNGPSSLEDEFAKMSHIHLPMNFNTLEGLKIGYALAGEHDEHDDVDGHDSHEEESGFEADIHPVFFAGYDRINRLVNLEESQSSGNSLDRSQANDKYLSVQSKKWNLGVGLEGDIHLPIPLTSFAVGFSYIKAKNYITKMYLNSKDEKRESLEYPIDSEKLGKWRVGDSMSFTSSGTMVVATMVGIEPFFHIGPEYIHSRTYRVNVTLEDEKTLEVEILTTKTNSIGLEGNALITGAEASAGHGLMRNIVYDIDLTSKLAFSTLKNLLNGRIDLANQDLVNSLGEIVLTSKIKSNYKSITGSIGVPILFYRGGSRGSYISEGVVDRPQENDLEKIYSTTVMSEKFSRGILSRHYWKQSRIHLQ